MPTDQNIPTERLIAEPLCVRLGIDRPTTPAVTTGRAVAALRPQGNSLPPEAKRIADALQAILAAPEDTVVTWGGRPHKFIRPHPANPSKGTQRIYRAGAIFAAQFTIAPVDEPGQHIYPKYAVVPNGKAAPGDPPFFLECEGNPTTLMAGNNVLPVTARDPETNNLERYPSSKPEVMMALNRILFRFLEELAAQVAGCDSGLFEANTQRSIKNGDFVISHIQWCCYFRSDPSRFSRILVALLAPPAATEVGFSSLARQMGLRFTYNTDERSTRVTSVLIERRHGKKNSAWSASAYNKRRRIGKMRQGKTLDPVEADLIDNNVRFDMTAHGPAIMEIIRNAKRALNLHSLNFQKLLPQDRAKEFLSGTPKRTARWLEFAVFILSHQLVDGKMQRGSFAEYLVPKVLDDVLRLRSIVCCTVEGLRAFEKLDDPVAKAWREQETYDAQGWANSICKAAGCEKSKVYKLQRVWLAKYNVDIAIPHAFYRDLLVYTPVSLMMPEDRDALLGARNRRDGEETLRILDDADGSFFAQMTEVVGTALRSPPTLLPAKVMGEVTAIQGAANGALSADSGSSKGGLSARKSAVLKVGSHSGHSPKQWAPRMPKTRLPDGIDKQSSLGELRAALRGINRALTRKLTDRQSDQLEYQQFEVEQLIWRRKDITHRQKLTRYKNKKIAQWNRMSGRRPFTLRSILPPPPPKK